MEDPQPESDGGASFDQKIPRDFNSDRRLGSPRFQQGVPAASRPRRVVVGLTLLNVTLLVAMVVLGVYCATTADENLQVPTSALGRLFLERDFLLNRSHIDRAAEEAEAALAGEWTGLQQLKLQLRQLKLRNDKLQGQIEGLSRERATLQTNKTTLEETCGRCQSGWMFLKSACYYFSNRDSLRKNWHDSRADCIGRGADLLVINNAEEQQRISNNYPRTYSGVNWWERGFWMGLVAPAGTWAWIDNATETDTMYWRDHQPSPDGEQSGNCGAFLYYADTVRTWYNAKCREHELSWICEKEPEPPRAN